MSEVAIGACDLAEVLGSAVALNLLFHISAAMGGHHHWPGRAAAPDVAAVWNAHHRGDCSRLNFDDQPVLLH